MAVYLYPIYTFATLALAIGGISLFQQTGQISTIILIGVIAGMTYDNFIISIGHLIGEGNLLKLLNRLRFLFHNLLVPTLVISASTIISNAGVQWAKNPVFHYGCWAVALGLIVCGLANDFKQEELIPSYFAGTLRYKPKKPAIPTTTILTALFCAIAGISMWFQIEWAWMFVGTLIMFGGNAFSTKPIGPLVASVVDVVFIFTLLATDWIV